MQYQKDTTEMQEYWKKYTEDTSLNTMFCDDRAEVLADLDTRELLTLLPDISAADVLELGAGIGRFTGELAKRAKSVIAVDFIDKFIEINRSVNEHFGNTTFLCADATKFSIPNESVDMVFTSWLFEYVNDALLLPTLTNYLGFLREDGYMFMRESCFHPSGTKVRTENPTIYRHPLEYSRALQSVSLPTEDGKGVYCFEVVFSRSVQSYVTVRQNFNNICWLVKKVRLICDHETSTAKCAEMKCTQRFLDENPYSMRSLSKRQLIFGNGLTSGNAAVIKKLCDRVQALKSGRHCTVLDVGSGLGNSAFYISENFDAQVTAIDLSCNMVGTALEVRLKRGNKSVQFEVGDVLQRRFASETFDFILCTDVVALITEKATLLKSLYDWLKPGGELILLDQCASENAKSAKLVKHAAKHRIALTGFDTYSGLLKQSGFENVQSEDVTSHFVEILRHESTRFAEQRDEFIAKFSEAEFNEMCADWTEKIEFCDSAELQWILFHVRKPQHA